MPAWGREHQRLASREPACARPPATTVRGRLLSPAPNLLRACLPLRRR
uniref:Uncharacterized protein n=1 Tax=Arundo donax TaxID=35708 RepID=A0A0A9C529_ARUDO